MATAAAFIRVTRTVSHVFGQRLRAHNANIVFADWAGRAEFRPFVPPVNTSPLRAADDGSRHAEG